MRASIDPFVLNKMPKLGIKLRIYIILCKIKRWKICSLNFHYAEISQINFELYSISSLHSFISKLTAAGLFDAGLFDYPLLLQPKIKAKIKRPWKINVIIPKRV